MDIAIIGAGSHFTLALLRSLYQTAQHEDYHLRLMDVRPGSLENLAQIIPRLNAVTRHSFRFSCHADQADAIAGADHVLAAFAVDFPAAFLRTCWVMRNHGIQFVEGETATPGALMATLRHLPPLLTIAQDIQSQAAGAWLHIINNPMPRLVLGIMQGTGYERVVGHCHGTLGVRRYLGLLTDTDPEEIDIFVAGINHFHLVQRAVDRRNDRDLLHALRSLPAEKVEQWKRDDFTQWRVFKELGYFVGHGIWHNFDYLPYANHRMFRHTDRNTWERACLIAQARRQADGEIGSDLASDDAVRRFLAIPESEQIFPIMQALSGEIAPRPFLSGNMPNHGHIPSLPEGAIVELPAIASADGIQLQRSPEALPLIFECWLRQQITIHQLSVRAVLEQSRHAAVEAIACDASFRDSDCGPDELLTDLLDANRGLVPSLH